LVRGVKS